jgi:hypothetical protein
VSNFSHHALTTIATWAEVGIILFMVWQRYGAASGTMSASPQATQRVRRSGFGRFLWENRTLIFAVLGLGLVAWLNLGRETQHAGVRVTDTSSSKPAEIATSLRLQFDASGKALEIDRNNLTWRVLEIDGAGVPVKAPMYGDCADGEPPFIYKPWLPPLMTADSSNLFDPGYCLEKSKNLVFVLVFEKPVSFKKINLNAQSARLPELDNKVITDQLAVFSIRGRLKNVVLEITMMN